MDPVIVVGAGISGVSCARTLHEVGLPVVVLDRGRRIGGRMASRRIDDRPVDLGASYFTVSEACFAEQVERWQISGLTHPWTDTFAVLSSETAPEIKSGPMRWGTPGGLRTLVEDLADGLDVRRHEVIRVLRGADGGLEVDGLPASSVVLAMPDGQAARLLGPDLIEVAEPLDRSYEPALVLVATYSRRSWDFEGAFVSDDPDVAWIADDGARRGDHATVLVAHSTPELAARHLNDPDGAEPFLTTALARLGVSDAPISTMVKRWSMAKPTGERDAAYFLTDDLVGVCGDGWGLVPKVEGAYLSGLALGEALIARLGQPA